MMGGYHVHDGKIFMGDKVIGYSAAFIGILPDGGLGSIALEPNITEMEERLVAYLIDNPSGGTKNELLKAIGLPEGESHSFAFLLARMCEQGRLIVAKEKRKQEVQWTVTTDYSAECRKASDRETVRREEYIDIYRPSPEAWIEAVS